MPVVNRIAAFADDMAGWRRHLHARPELGFDCHETARFVVERLQEFGVDRIETGIATSGIVAVIEGQGAGGTIGLRADMDALPIAEATGAAHASRHAGRMHACGHDGHTAMLLGAARYLAETRSFAGRVALIFQPAEENGGGGGVMVDEGVMERFGIERVFALHTAPGLSAGSFHTQPGPALASADTFNIHVTGRGGHGAMPHEAADPIPPALAIGQALDTVTSRNRHARDDLVISLTQVHAGTADNVIPDTAFLQGTVRCFAPEVRDMAERRIGEIVAGQAAAFGVAAALDYERGYPATVNDADAARFAAQVAGEVSDAVDGEAGREMGAEDFSYMLAARPGAFLFLGQGEGPGLHHPEFDFNDAVAPVGASFFARLVERAQPL
jgi:hippurate hydrolase